MKLTLLASALLVSTTAMAAPMNDGDIASIMKTANGAEIAAAKVAKSKAQDKDVKEFATHMITDHTKNEVEGKAIETKNKIKTASNETAMTMQKDADAKLADMKNMTGAAFDKAYIDEQVAMHQQLLSSLDKDLIPAAQNSDLKSYLETTKKHVQSHLEMAQKIQTALAK